MYFEPDTFVLDAALSARVEALAPAQGDPRHPFDLGSANGKPRSEPARRKVVGYPPLSELGDLQRREVHEELLDADSFEDLPGKWRAAILEAEQHRPKLRVV